MAIRDNLKGGSSKKLYEALQYSGLVTEDMTFAEMCAVLAAEYPEFFKLYNEGINGGEFVSYALTTNANNYYKPAMPTTTFSDAITISTKASSGGVISKPIDLSAYNTIKFTHYSEIVTQPTYDSYNAYVKFFICKEKTTNIVPIVLEGLLINSKFNEGNIEIDITSLKGEYYIGFDVYAYGSFATQTIISNMILEV